MSSSASVITNRPRWGSLRTSPSWTRRCMASRSGPRLTPRRAARSASPSCEPGGSEPYMIADLSSSEMISTVDLRGTGSSSPSRPMSGRLRTEKCAQARADSAVAGDAQALPDTHLVRGEDGFAQPRLQLVQPGDGVQRGVRYEHRLGAWVVVGGDEVQDVVAAQGADLGGRHDAPAGQGDDLDAGVVQEAGEPRGDVLGVGGRDRDPAEAEVAGGVDEGERGAGRR